jgi:ferredoxin
MPALSLLTGIISSPPQAVEVDVKQCLRKRLRSCDCSYCIDTCPANALSLKNREVLLDTQKCSECMQCVAVCPNDAFLFSGYDFDSKCRLFQNRERIVFTCSRQSYGHPEDQIVPCMGVFSIELLFVMGMTGPPVISFNVSGCLSCVNKSTSDSFLKALEYLEKQVSPFLRTKFDILKERNVADYSESDRRRGYISSV